MARFRHASQIKWLVLGRKESQASKTQIACEFYQESRKDIQTGQSKTRQDRIHDYPRKSGAIIHSYHSNPGINSMKTFDEAFEIWSLWDKYLHKDKRTFMEYFEEEHGIILKECTSFETLESLCETFIQQKWKD